MIEHGTYTVELDGRMLKTISVDILITLQRRPFVHK